jgi:hypothetical protein
MRPQSMLCIRLLIDVLRVHALRVSLYLQVCVYTTLLSVYH